MKRAEIIAPVALIALGGLLLLNNLDWNYDLGEFIGRWWPAFLIVIGAGHVARGIVEGTPIAGGLILTLVGIGFQIHHLRPELSVGDLFRTYWPLAIIAVGLSQLLMFGRGRWYGRAHGR